MGFRRGGGEGHVMETLLVGCQEPWSYASVREACIRQNWQIFGGTLNGLWPLALCWEIIFQSFSEIHDKNSICIITKVAMKFFRSEIAPLPPPPFLEFLRKFIHFGEYRPPLETLASEWLISVECKATGIAKKCNLAQSDLGHNPSSVQCSDWTIKRKTFFFVWFGQ